MSLKSILCMTLVISMGKSHAQKPDTLAVVPFLVVGETKNPDVYRLGFPDGIAHYLKKYYHVVIVSRTRLADVLQELRLSQSGVLNRENVLTAGQLLPANGIVSGTIYSSGKRVRADVHLINAWTGELCFEISREEKLNSPEDIFRFQWEVSRQFAARLRMEPTTHMDGSKEMVVSEDAYVHFIRALAYLYSGNIELAREESAWSLRLDPHFSTARSFDEELENAIEEMENALEEMKKN